MSTWQRTLWISFFARLVTAIGFSTIFPFLPLYVAALGSSSNLSVEFLAGAVFSAQALTMMIASPFWGSVADHYGRKLMVQRAMFGGAVITGMMAFVTTAEQLVLLRAVQGIITGVVSATNALVAAVVPRERMGYAMGLMLLGTWTGTAIGPIMGGLMADAFGYQSTFIATAILLLIAGILVQIGIQEVFVPAAEQQPLMSFWKDWGRILRTQGIIVNYILHFASAMGRSLLLPIAPLIVMSLMSSNSNSVATATGLMTGIASAAATASAFYFGKLGDRIGHRRIFIGGALFTALAYIPQVFVNEVWQLIFFQALAGVGAGSILPSLSALLSLITKPGDEGAVYGLENSIVAASRTVAPLLGSSFAIWFGLRSIYALTAALFLLAMVIAIYFLPPTRQTQAASAQKKPSPASATS